MLYIFKNGNIQEEKLIIDGAITSQLFYNKNGTINNAK